MGQKQIIVDGKKLEYEGLFDPKDLYSIIDEQFQQHSFDKNEHKNSEHIYEDEKQLIMDLRPYKKLSDYVKVEIKMIIIAKHLKEVEIEKDGVKRKLYKGHINITFTAYMYTDYENAWETRPFYFTFRMLIDKFVYKGYMDQAKEELVNLTDEVYNEVRTYLNMHRYY